MTGGRGHASTLPGAALAGLIRRRHDALRNHAEAQELVQEVFVQALRKEDLFKSPGVAETLDWAAALSELDVVALDPATVSDTLGVLLKYQDDIARVRGSEAAKLLEEIRAGLPLS